MASHCRNRRPVFPFLWIHTPTVLRLAQLFSFPSRLPASPAANAARDRAPLLALGLLAETSVWFSGNRRELPIKDELPAVDVPLLVIFRYSLAR